MNVWSKVRRSDEQKTWSVVGSWEEDSSYLVIEMQKSGKRRLMLKSAYDRPACYPYTIPVYKMLGEMKWERNNHSTELHEIKKMKSRDMM